MIGDRKCSTRVEQTGPRASLLCLIKNSEKKDKRKASKVKFEKEHQ